MNSILYLAFICLNYISINKIKKYYRTINCSESRKNCNKISSNSCFRYRKIFTNKVYLQLRTINIDNYFKNLRY